MLTAAMGVVLALLVGIAVLLYAAGRARARALAEVVRTDIEPFLRRKAAESGLPGAAPTWTARTEPEEIVTYASGLARRLLERERKGGATPASIELARTQPAGVKND
jgi:hypothetical protein